MRVVRVVGMLWREMTGSKRSSLVISTSVDFFVFRFFVFFLITFFYLTNNKCDINFFHIGKLSSLKHSN